MGRFVRSSIWITIIISDPTGGVGAVTCCFCLLPCGRAGGECQRSRPCPCNSRSSQPSCASCRRTGRLPVRLHIKGSYKSVNGTREVSLYHRENQLRYVIVECYLTTRVVCCTSRCMRACEESALRTNNRCVLLAPPFHGSRARNLLQTWQVC